MKRPDGYDRPASVPAQTTRSSKGLLERTQPNANSAESTATDAKPVKPLKPGRQNKAGRRNKSGTRNKSGEDRRRRVPRPSADRTAAADLRAAERARRRHDKAELKRFTRRTRVRRIGIAIGAGVVVVLIALILVAVYSPILALRTITVDGTSRLDPATVEAAIDGQLGTPLALLDDDEITRDLSSFTLIRSYVTEIVPPNTLLVHIVERVPVGQVQSPRGFELVDPAGVTIETAKTRIEGVPLIQLASSDKVGGEGFESIAEVLLALPVDLRNQVSTITARTHDDVTFTLAAGDIRVVWGSVDDSPVKVPTLSALLAARGNHAGEYDVSAPGNAIYRAG